MDIKQAITEQFDAFSSEIVVNNLPSIDGVLPVNRKVMYALHRNRITSKTNYIKMLRASAYSIVYYVYGDMPLTGAMKNMGNNGLNYFLLDPKGSFGNKNKVNG
jgi:DNA gyrase/topoisomerase IV subunit A